MFLNALSITIMIFGSVLALVYILLLASSKQYNYLLEPLNKKEFLLCDLYGVGFKMLDIVKYKYTSRGERAKKQHLALIYGEKHAEYYLRINAAQRLTMAFTFIVLGFALFGLTSDLTIIFVFLLFAFAAYYYFNTLPKTTLDKKTNQILNDFADVVSKIALLVGAGMIMKEAWEKVAYTGERELYQEMQKVVDDMRNGVSEVDAYASFSTRCMSPEIKKFTSTVIQGIMKGNAELVEMIKQQSRETWDSKRHRVKQQGEKAASKLLIPICVMFIGVLIMIVVPIFANLGI